MAHHPKRPGDRPTVPPTRETREQATIRMVNDPRTWPNLILPLKHRTETDPSGFPRLAVLAASFDEPPVLSILRDACMWAMPAQADYHKITADAVLAEGWLVD